MVGLQIKSNWVRGWTGFLSSCLGAAWVAFGFESLRGADSPSEKVDFNSQIQPIFSRNCMNCHGPDKQRGGLRLDSKNSVFQGGDSGKPAIVPSQANSGILLQRITTEDASLRMPPKGERLTREEIRLIHQWISQGAPWPEGRSKPTAKDAKTEMRVTDSDREHWAFRPLKPIEPLTLKGSIPPSSSVDRFIFEKLISKNLKPAPSTDKRTLIRRVTFDLTGLPPTPKEIDSFLADSAPDAYQRLVDRLLTSPHYGERWGRHWLDIARYADSDGYENDQDRKSAWRYRDFVIRALNDDMPFDQFVRLQIAGDEFSPDDPLAVIATGFCTSAPSLETTPADTDENKAKIRYDELDNILSTTGSGLLGLTIGCARCHDHKFDPIPTRDYYRLLGAFTHAERREVLLSRPQRDLERWLNEQRRLYREDKMTELGLTNDQKFWLRQPEHFFVPIQQDLYRRYGKALVPSDQALREWMKEPQRQTLRRLESLVTNAPKADKNETALALLDRGSQAEPNFLLNRGSVTDKKEEVKAGFLAVLSSKVSPDGFLTRAKSRAKSAADSAVGTTYHRAALAEWLTDDHDGAGALLARVIVNRLWQHHFGEGLVRTPDDFGNTSERPSHPELLDWLASELIRGGWRLKTIHRIIMNSETYRQSSRGDQTNKTVDPDNRLLWYRKPTRLESEAIRDTMLSVSARLNPAMYGPPFRAVIPAEAVATRSKDAYPTNIKDGPDTWKRSVYAFIKRSVPNPTGEIFDAPDPTSACGRRNTTSVPTQNLALLNDPLVRGCATDLAARTKKEAGPNPRDRVLLAFQICLGRCPSEDELTSLTRFLGTKDLESAMTDLCHVLFTLNEFLYID